MSLAKVRRPETISLYSADRFGSLAHTCALNSSSRCCSYFCLISLIELPAGTMEGLNFQAHAEHPQPRKRSFSTHTNSRAMMAGFYTRMFDLCRGARHHRNALTCPLVEDEIAARRG